MRATVMRLISVLWLVGVVLALTPAQLAPSAPALLDTNAVDSYVEDYLDRHGLAGAAVAIVENGQVVHTAGYGTSAPGIEMTSITPMRIGSLSKHMTSFALLQLVDDGTVQLDDAVVEHLPEFPLADDRVSDITIRHLLSHTSGLPSPLLLEPANTLREGVARLQNWQLDADPGKQYRYSNINYHVAARLIETVTNMPFATYLQVNLFQPLAMDDTRSVDTASAPVAGLHDGHVTAYDTAVQLRERQQLLPGAGGVVTTAEDQARWLAMLTNDAATPAGEQLLAAELLHEAQSPQPGADGNGLGWALEDDTDALRVGHSSATSRYTARIDLVPKSSYGVVVMLNSYTPAMEHYAEISTGLINIAQGDSAQPGIPWPTLLDAILGLLTVLIIVLTALGIRGARDWSRRRTGWSDLRFGLRLLPQALTPLLAVFIFLVLPSLENAASTPVDVFAFWPAMMLQLLALGGSGLSLLIARGIHRRSTRHT